MPKKVTPKKCARLIDVDRDLFVVEMKVINLKDWDPFWMSHFKRNTDKLEYKEREGASITLEVGKMKKEQLFGPW